MAEAKSIARMAEAKSIARIAIDNVVEQFPYLTDCMAKTSTAERCKQKGSHSETNLKRIQDITTRLEEIRLLRFVHGLKYGGSVPLSIDLRDRIVERAQALQTERADLMKEAEALTNETLVSEVQAAANVDAAASMNAKK